MYSKKRLLLVLFCCISVLTEAQINPRQYRIQKKIVCQQGAVVSAHALASETGLLMLKKGGNAFDAAIATQLALAVVYPGAGNIGGGGFLVGHMANGKNIVIDYRETAPAKAHKDMYLDSAGKPISKLSQDGHLSAGVPGTVAGLFATLKYARLPFKTLIAPAIELAAKGFAVTDSQAASLNRTRQSFLALNRKAVAFVRNSDWKKGDILVQPELAATLRRISRQGVKGFYAGETARLIVEEMNAGQGIISYEDLARYKAKERVAMEFLYKGYRIITLPLPSSGGILLKQMFGMIAGKNMGAMGFHSALAIQYMVEAERRAYADRAQYLGDADFVKVPVKKLTSNDYLQQRMNDFIPGKAGSSDSTKAGSIAESEETTHISIIDKDGNAVSVTTTLNGSYGSKTVVSGAGFLLNNEMDDFSIKEGFPNLYGVTGSAANAIAPHKRMLSSMTPTIVLKNNRPYLIVGSPGGSTIPTSVFQTLLNIIDFNLTPEEAVNQPKFHHQWLPDQVEVEPDFPEGVKKQLTDMGYRVNKRDPIGRVELILVREVFGRFITAIGDKRGDDSAAGY
ncbi:MAG TPA: gamma-glutamyltransferase [Ferruginibacter sp.]|nr:gamma-glutamyltransferase [Ferruginibacter sp.]